MTQPLATDAANAPPHSPYSVGTLTYSKAGLFTLFSWLLWGDFCFQLFESAGGPGILGLYLQDNYHVSNFQVNILCNFIPMIIGTIMTPIISFKSDRTRSKYGRRIPYILFTMPFLCLFAIGIGYSDDIMELAKHLLDEKSLITPFTAGMIGIGFIAIGFAFFNEFVGTIFWYLFADVVPSHFLGRFMGLFRVVGTATGFFINITLAQYQLTHMKAIHVAVALLYFVGFSLMCWRVKEGEYPPVTDVTKDTSFLDQVKLYFRECFTHPIFILIYLMSGTQALTKGVNPSGLFALHLGKHQAEAGSGIGSVIMLQNGKCVLSAGQDGSIRFWDCANPRKLKENGGFTSRSGAPVRAMSLSADGKTLVLLADTGAIEVWDLASKTLKSTITTGSDDAKTVKIAPDGATLAAAGHSKTIQVWDIGTGTCLFTLSGHDGPVNAIDFSSDSKRLVSGGDDRKIILWDLVQRRMIREITGSPGPVYAVAFSPALESLAVNRGVTAAAKSSARAYVTDYLRDVFTNESLFDGSATAHSRITTGDQWILAGGRDADRDDQRAAVRIWDAADGKLLQTLRGHRQSVTSLQYKPDLRCILSGSLDGSIRLWNPVAISPTADDQSYKTFSGYTQAVTGISALPEGRFMANAGKDGALHLWNLDQGVSLRKAGVSASFFTIITLLLSYTFGAMVDRYHAIRMLFWVTLISLPFNYLPFWFYNDYLSGMWLNLIRMPFTGLIAAASSVFLILLFPKDKYGQMCSANALVKQFVAAFAGLLGALLMDRITGYSMLTDNFRYGFLLQGVSITLSCLALIGIYYYWNKLGGDNYVAPKV